MKKIDLRTAIIFGVGTGTALGVALHDTSVGIALGVAIGLTLGFTSNSRHDKSDSHKGERS